MRQTSVPGMQSWGMERAETIAMFNRQRMQGYDHVQAGLMVTMGLGACYWLMVSVLTGMQEVEQEQTNQSLIPCMRV